MDSDSDVEIIVARLAAVEAQLAALNEALAPLVEMFGSMASMFAGGGASSPMDAVVKMLG